MIHAVAAGVATPAGTRPGLTGALEGERLAVATAAAGVALVPLLSPPGPAGVAPVDVFVAVALAACAYWVGTSRRGLRFPFAVPAGLLMVGGALGAIVGPVPGTGVLALVQELLLVLWCWAVFNVASSAARLRVLMAAWAYAAIAWAVLLFVGLAVGLTFLTGQTAAEGTRTSLTFMDPNYAANYWVISIMVLWATGRPHRRLWRVLAYALFLAALVSTGSNGGIASLLIALAVVSVLVTYRRFGLQAAVPVLAAFALAGYVLATDVSLTAIQQAASRSPHGIIRDGVGHGQKAMASRSTILGESARLWREGGPLGTGPVSTKARLRADMAPYVKEAHNDYAAALVERGAIGFLGLLALLAGLTRRVPALASGRLREDVVAAVPHPHALVGALAGTLGAMAVLELLHARHVWTLFALVTAVAIWGGRR